MILVSKHVGAILNVLI